MNGTSASDKKHIGHPTSQCEKVIRHLQLFGSIDPVQALQEYGILRLAARINDLRVEHEIETHIIETLNRFGDPVRHARYTLAMKGSELR